MGQEKCGQSALGSVRKSSELPELGVGTLLFYPEGSLMLLGINPDLGLFTTFQRPTVQILTLLF